jgi:hypothetical protein
MSSAGLRIARAFVGSAAAIVFLALAAAYCFL